jgi:hypothetical protein
MRGTLPALMRATCTDATRECHEGTRNGHAAGGRGPSVCAWSEAAIDECGEAVEQALQPELEEVLHDRMAGTWVSSHSSLFRPLAASASASSSRFTAVPRT